MENRRVRVRDKEGKIKLIFETFAKIVNERGYDHLSTRHIAETANISIGTVYHYFPRGKHEIAGGFMEYVSHDIFDPEMFNTGQQDLSAFLQNLIKRYLRTHNENLAIHRAIDQAILASPDVAENHRRSVITNLRAVVNELRNRNLFIDLPEQEVLQRFLLFYNLMEAIIHRHLLIHPFFDNDDALEQFLVTMVHNIISNSARAFYSSCSRLRV
jgi:AcrR family transcriptional regulator